MNVIAAASKESQREPSSTDDVICRHVLSTRCILSGKDPEFNLLLVFNFGHRADTPYIVAKIAGVTKPTPEGQLRPQPKADPVGPCRAVPHTTVERHHQRTSKERSELVQNISFDMPFDGLVYVIDVLI